MVLDIKQTKFRDFPLISNVVTCGAHEKVIDVTKILAESNIGSIVITNSDGTIGGIFTERDLLKLIGKEGPDALEQSISLHMTSKVKTVGLDTPLAVGFALMRLSKFRHLVIVDEKKKCIGIVSLKDVLEYTLDNIAEED